MEYIFKRMKFVYLERNRGIFWFILFLGLKYFILSLYFIIILEIFRFRVRGNFFFLVLICKGLRFIFKVVVL